MKKFSLALVFLFLFLVGCGELTAEQLHKKLEKKVNRIHSYHATLEGEVKGIETAEKYQVEQWFRMPGHYKVSFENQEGQGQTFVVKDKTTGIHETTLDEWYILKDGELEYDTTPPFLLSSYLDNLLNSGSSLTVLGEEEFNSKNYYVVELNSPHSYYRHKEKMWLDAKTLMPIRIEVYGQNGELRSSLLFTRISINPDISDEEFHIPD